MKPKNRKEIFLNALAKGEPVGIEPLTRDEKYLAQQDERESKGTPGVTSWNDLQDRPFGESTETAQVEKVFLSNVTKTYFGGGYVSYMDECRPEEGSYIKLTAVVNGSTYSHEGASTQYTDDYGNTRYYIGNASLYVSARPNTGENYYVELSEGSGLIYCPPEEPTLNEDVTFVNVSYTVAEEQTVVHPIPTEYLPEALQIGEETTSTRTEYKTNMAIFDAMCDVYGTAQELLYVVDGKEYRLITKEAYVTADSGSMLRYVGDISLLPSSAGTAYDGDTSGHDVPFFFGIYVNAQTVGNDWAYSSALGGAESVSVYKETVKTAVQRLDEKFMPLLTSPNGTKYKLTVADDGTLSAVQA